TSPPSAITINANTYTISGTAEANALVQVWQGGSVVGAQQLTGGATSYSLSVPLTQNAANSFTVTAADAAGNLSALATVPTITEDSTAPGVPTITDPA